MDNPSEIVRCVSRIWRIYRRQESMCRSAMRLEMPSKFRCLLGCGHMAYMLFRCEIGSIYDQVKCILSDGELGSIVRSNDELQPDQQQCNDYIHKILAGQKELISAYHNLICELGSYHEAVEICSGHMEKLTEHSRNLSMHKVNLPQNQPAVYFSVA